MKIAVFGMGYVGLSNAALLAQHHQVMAVDIDPRRVELINDKRSPIQDADISHFLLEKPLDLVATDSATEALTDADYAIIATPTDYNPETNSFNTSYVDAVLDTIFTHRNDISIVIKSTLPIGFTEEANRRFNTNKIFFSPEFLREGKALFDNLHPSRIVVGSDSKEAKRFAELLQEGAVKENVPMLVTGNTEAETIKLFSNTYLAMRVSFFNMLDGYAQQKGLSSKQIIEGVSFDPRVGDHYNNPSFGYGGYCLPKDTKQLLCELESLDSSLMSAIVTSNDERKQFIADQIIQRAESVVGVYRLIMKSGSDNFRSSAIFDVIKLIIEAGKTVIVYEPEYTGDLPFAAELINDLGQFKAQSGIVICNRMDKEITDIADKVFTRDVFHRD